MTGKTTPDVECICDPIIGRECAWHAFGYKFDRFAAALGYPISHARFKPFHKRCWCGIVHGPLHKRDVPPEPREDNAYRETSTDEWIPSPRDFEGEP